jgi:hypothetical protein
MASLVRPPADDGNFRAQDTAFSAGKIGYFEALLRFWEAAKGPQLVASQQ